MRTAITTLAPVLLLSVFAGACDDDRDLDSSALTATLQGRLDHIRDLGVTGLQAELQIDDERVLLRSGVARYGEEEPVPWSGHFRMGSVTKTFVAVVVLQLVGEGKLGLDDSVETWLPGVVVGEGYDAEKITIRQLLQHTSGIFNYTTSMLADFDVEAFESLRFQEFEPEELVAIALQHPPDFAPGTAWNYSNTNYILAGMVIERVTGRAWHEEVDARIVQPLGLGSTFEPGDDVELPGPHANGFEQFEPGGPMLDATRANQSFADAAGSLVSTNADLVRFFAALQGGELLEAAELAAMQTTVEATSLQAIVPGVRYGLGIMQLPGTCNEPYWSHFGDTFGYSTRNAVSHDGSRVVVFSLTGNLAGEAVLDVIGESLRILDDAMCDEP